MDVNKILGELRNEREQIEDAIISLERLARGRGKRRGRPPAGMKDAGTATNCGRPAKRAKRTSFDLERGGRPQAGQPIALPLC